MFIEDGTETLVRFEKDGEPFVISVDDESYARCLNDGYVVVEEIMIHTRLPQDPDTGLYDPTRRSGND